MSGDRDRDEVMERRLEWGLREVAGGERAPDVTRAVLMRAASGEVVDEAAAAPRPHRWLAAALLLLGIGVVVAVFVAERERGLPEPEPAPLAPPQEPDCIEVASLEALAALPPDTRAVELRNLPDAAVKVLVQRCPKLEHLRVFASTAYYRQDDPAVAVSITDAALADLGALTSLRRLQLVGTDQVSGPGLRQLERLPLLADLEFSYFDLDDDALQVLPRLPSLRQLSLLLNHGFGDRGVAAIANCPGLRGLVLTSCSQLHASSLRQLGRLSHLRQLNLNGIGDHWRGNGRPRDLAGARERLQRAMVEALRIDAGMRVAGLSDWPELEYLDLGGSRLLEPDVGRRLRQGCPNLRMLELSDCPLIDDTTVAEVLGLRHLRRLNLSRCPNIREHSFPLLAAATQLQEIRLDETPWLTLQQAERLFASGRRVIAQRTGDAQFNAGMADLDQQYRARYLLPRYEQVASLAEIAALPADATHVAVRGMGDEAAAALAKRPNLIGLQFFQNGGRVRWSDAAFALLAQLPALEELELLNVDGVRASGLARLQTLPKLRKLSLHVVNRKDDAEAAQSALEPLPGFPALEQLNLDSTSSFGEQGMTAIAGCKRLKTLSLSSCTQLRADWIAMLGALTSLEDLDLSNAGDVTDRALMGLQPLTRLRTLVLSNGRFTSMGLQTLTEMRGLQNLLLNDNAGLATSALLQVPTSVTRLLLDNCPGLDKSAGPLLRDRFPGLRKLSLAQNDWVDDDALMAVLQLPQLEVLELRDCRSPTSKSFPAILAARTLRKLDATRCAWLTDELAAQLQQKRPELMVNRKVW